MSTASDAGHVTYTGDLATYKKLHRRVSAQRGRPQHCEDCGTTDPAKRYHWANVGGDYADPYAYRRLCAHCHRSRDVAQLRGGTMSPAEIAKRYKISRQTIGDDIKAGVLKAERVTGARRGVWRITPEDLDDYLHRKAARLDIQGRAHLSAAEACERLRVSRNTLHKLIRSGLLEAQRSGPSLNSHYRITEQAIDGYITRQTAEAAS